MPKRKSGARTRTNKGPWKHIAQRERRKAAEERQALRDQKTPQQQLAHLDKYGFVAKRERARLEAQIKTEK